MQTDPLHPTTFRLPRAFITALLFSAFALGFLFTPYWGMAQSPAARIAALAVTLLLGVVWSAWSGSDVTIRAGVKGWMLFAALALVMAALNTPQLTTGIPWRGDEDFHIHKVRVFLGVFARIRYPLLAALAATGVLLYLAWRKPRWALVAGAAATLGAMLYVLFNNPLARHPAHFLLRYPFFSYWFAVIGPAAGRALDTPYHEALYRVLPFLFACAVAWAWGRSFPSFGAWTGLLLGVAAATIPLLFYYSSILYLEMPAVFLMLLVCFAIRDLLTVEPDALPRQPAWYALLLIGFIKETALPFLLAFLLCRWAARVWRTGRGPMNLAPRAWAGELRVAFSVLMPLALYLFFRGAFYSSGRSFGLHLENLLQWEAYLSLASSFASQFGPFLVFFVAGCLLLARRRETITLAFLLVAFAATPLFHLVDNWIFAGYSRFNLFLLPVVLAASSEFFRWLSVRGKIYPAALAVLAIAVSLVISPVRADGTKQPYWDAYLVDTSEHYYPYREAITFLIASHPDEHVLIGGLTYNYYLDFYAQKYNWKTWEVFMRGEDTPGNAEALSAALAEARLRGIPVVLFHILGDAVPQPRDASGYVQEKVVQNSAHALVIYRDQ